MKLNFQELTTNHIYEYYTFTNQFTSFSDINFTSLISWCPAVLFELNSQNLFLHFEDYSSDKVILTGLSLNPDYFTEILLDTHSSIQNSIVDTVPAAVINKLSTEVLRSKFKISDDQADYLYTPSSQLELIGNKFSWHRRKLSIFKRSGNQVSITVERNFSKEEADIFATIWTQWKEASNPKEVDAIKRYIHNFEKFINQYVIKVYLNDSLEGFAFCEMVEGATKDFLIHFFKTNKAFEGLSNYLFFEIAKYTNSMNVDYINFEQDLEEPGLRYYKQHLRPDMMLNKYHLISN